MLSCCWIPSLSQITTGTRFLVLLGLLLTSCNRPSSQLETEATAPQMQLKVVPAGQTNAPAGTACIDFSKIMNDVSKGLVTERELQQRIGSVYENARLATVVSGSPKPPDDFGPSAEEMLRSLIEGDKKLFAAAVDRFS